MSSLVSIPFLLLISIWYASAQNAGGVSGKSVCDGLCNCDKTGEIDCERQDLTTVYLDPVLTPEKVNVLNLKSNKITRIKKGEIMMGKGTGLTRLTLSDNLISQIDDGAFETTPALETLDLKNNKLTGLSKDTFNGLPNLIQLWLEHNLIENLTSKSVFATMTKLRYLSLDWTPIKNVDNATFVGLDNLIDLSIDHAELSLLPTDTLKPLARLETLSLRHNRFHVIPLEELRWLPQLKRLDFSGNPIVTINSNAFRHNPHLRELKFVNMPALNYIEDCAFCNVHELRTLQITNCSKLTDFDPESFGRDIVYFRSIETIDLVNNSLTKLDEDLVHWENVTGIIHLAGNPWQCGCDMMWMANSKIKFDQKNPPICAEPTRLKGKSILTLDNHAAGLCLPRLAGRIRVGRVFLIAAGLILVFGLFTTTWYLFSKRSRNGLKLRNLFYKPQLPEYAYRNLAMGEEADDQVVVTNDGASILPKNNKKIGRDLASRLADQS